MPAPSENAWGHLGPDDSRWGEPAPAPAAAAPAGPRLVDLLDGGFRAVRSTWPTLVVATAATATVLTVVDVLVLYPVAEWAAGTLERATSWAAEAGRDGDVPGTSGLAVGVLGVVEAGTRFLLLAGTLLICGLLAPAVTSAAPPVQGLGALWARVRPRLAPLVATAGVVAALVLTASVVGAVPGAMLAATGDGDAAIAGAMLAVAGGSLGLVTALLWWGVRLCVAPAAVVLEGLGVRAALRRSRALTAGRYLRVLGVLVVVWLITWALQGLVTAPFATLSAVLVSSGAGSGILDVSAWHLAVTGLGVVVSAAVAYPLLAAVLTLMFDELRAVPADHPRQEPS